MYDDYMPATKQKSKGAVSHFQIDALQYIMPHENITKMSADHFAQFVMKCE